MTNAKQLSQAPLLSLPFGIRHLAFGIDQVAVFNHVACLWYPPRASPSFAAATHTSEEMMRLARRTVFGLCSLLLVFAYLPALMAQAPRTVPLYQQFLSNANPLELVAAKKADRIAWTAYEEGKRNAYTAVAPSFTPVRLTNFLKDDGIDISNIRISDDGRTVVFVRGTNPNRDGWVANASADPNGAERAIWAVRTALRPGSGQAVGRAWRVAEGGSPELSPDGSSVLFVKEGEIYRARVTAVKPIAAMDRGEKAFIRNWGVQSSPKWSPDGKKIAFVSTRQDHSFIAVYDMATRSISYMAPSVDFDTNPLWSADSKHIVFTRRPGLAFAQQAQQGGGGIGIPPGPAFQANQPGRGGRGGQGAPQTGNAPARIAPVPGLARGAFKGGYTLSVWKADVATGEGQEVWHNEPNDRKFTTINNPRLAGHYLVFPMLAGGGGRGRGNPQVEAAPPQQQDEWDRYYSIDLSVANSKPVLLTTTDGLIEDQTSVAISQDHRTFYYCTNAKDIDRRHIWAVPVSGGTPYQVTGGMGIETWPVPLASGKFLATQSADWRRPQSIGVWRLGTATLNAAQQNWTFPTAAQMKKFPTDLHVEPQAVMTKAADGLEVPNQLFLPKDIKPGEKRPAIVFVHGGPVRQMLLGYHYMHFYHWSYGINQWLANQGYVVLSVNYRSGIGYGRSFRQAPNTGGRGNAEYQDVLAGGKYLQSRPDVDPNRIGIWGLSYGGVLTAQALARNSDIFKAGVDLAGVHLWGNSLDPDSVSFKSSAIGAIDGWTSPVLLVHGDDDRNVAFQQTTGLVQLLRQRDVYYELIVFPDDTHESMLHSRWIYTLDRMETFLKKFLGDTRRITTEAAK
jgi:dipeptidyl aminopeptidase/acylaminoacyl peptidase